ncbi:uncharacterized protein LOC141703032 [Apium graveolens]|uniref:uncharacterized protein LOC141703032 n=1 Tax=Apium graveolens TaxID=4045 RepID=UPI003D7B8A50
MATGTRITFADIQNPLFLYPSDGPLSVSVSKLQGSADYRSWKRSMEIQLAAKRKLGFVTGAVLRTTDEVNVVQWDTCNNLVISWLHNNVSDSIRKSILFVESASEIWTQLEKRFSLTNGSRKYKLNCDLFATKQNKLTVANYFTALSEIWEEIEALKVLPSITVITPEITKLLDSIHTMKEEAKLFQFLNGLNDCYASQRSQLLMMQPLPTVESACSAIQQEESQRQLLKYESISQDFDVSAMYSKNTRVYECTICHGKGHTADRMSNNVVMQNTEPDPNQNEVTITESQLQQLLQLLPNASKSVSKSDTDDELDLSFSGMAFCGVISQVSDKWIMDSDASDHIVSTISHLTNVRCAPANCVIKLPTGESASISHIGELQLKNKLWLRNVLFVPRFKHNLLSIHKLSQDNNCHIRFTPLTCDIIDNTTAELITTGHLDQGLYYLQDLSSDVQDSIKFSQDRGLLAVIMLVCSLLFSYGITVLGMPLIQL